MTEHCPLRRTHPADPGKVPSFCMERCIETTQLRANVPYDEYPDHTKAPDEPRCIHPSTDFSHDTIASLGVFSRMYVVVDLCEVCGEEIGEQGYVFTCDLPDAETELPLHKALGL